MNYSNKQVARVPRLIQTMLERLESRVGREGWKGRLEGKIGREDRKGRLEWKVRREGWMGRLEGKVEGKVGREDWKGRFEVLAGFGKEGVPRGWFWQVFG